MKNIIIINMKNKDKNIIQKMAKFSGDFCKKEDFEKLDDEWKKLILKFKKEGKNMDTI